MVQMLLIVFITLSCSLTVPSFGLRITGTMKGLYPLDSSLTWKRYSHYVGKFGVNADQPLYVYGNASQRSDVSAHSKMMLVVAPTSKWEKFKDLSELSYKTGELTYLACNKTILAPFLPTPCSTRDNQYYRLVPCSGLCNNSQQNVLPDEANFLFNVVPTDTEFYYIFFVYCKMNTPCEWTASTSVDFEYDISVTRDPFSHHNPFTFQFPANLEGLLATYVTFSLLYTILIIVHVVMNFNRCRSRKLCSIHILVWLFTVAMVMEFINMIFGLMHYGVYSNNGQGAKTLFYLKELFNLVGDWFLILVLVLIASGWQVTVKSIKWKYASFPIWAIYIVFSLIYYMWEVIFLETEPWDLKDPLQTWAGGLYLAVRGMVLFYVWYQIYHIHQQEEDVSKLRLYKTLFVLFTVWFWYLPLLVFIVTFSGHVSASLIIINISTAMNFLANLVMVILFCPFWSHKHFQFDDQPMSQAGWTSLSYSKMGSI